MKQLGEPVSEVLEAEQGELFKPQTIAALEGADFAENSQLGFGI